jgi:hypothetical protein
MRILQAEHVSTCRVFFTYSNRGMISVGNFCLYISTSYVYISLVILYPEIVLYSILINVMVYCTSKNKFFVQICR